MTIDKRSETIEACEEVCSPTIIHGEVITKVRGGLPSQEILGEVANLFKVLGDLTRTRILRALFESEMCVCDLAHLLGMTQSATSHQLRVLKQAKLVKNRKEGKVVYYSLADQHVIQIFDQAFEHINEDKER